MKTGLQRLHIELELFRDPDDCKHVLVCFSQDHHAEQRHLLAHDSQPVSQESITESLTKIVTQIIEGSEFSNGDTQRLIQRHSEKKIQAAQSA
jgi:hypothetical protein